ncbi:DUF6777 domain-containing protein [Streptomyces sp. NPDC097619]|uniref:DUF6777 domain-containing protein n=1 Tax=Streptomyces sp. NPDC097619 TaxID=3157228 RepID=UPI00331D7DB1
MRTPVSRYALACTAALGLLAAAGCGGTEKARFAPTGREVLLQPVADAGPDPFTASSATSTVALPLPQAPRQGAPGPAADADAAPAPGPGLRAVSGSTPGLYGGIHKRGSCDVEQQVRTLTADRNKARAFAGAAGIEPARIPDFLRELTPVVLRADTRVTSHGFKGGRGVAYQAILQAGSPVLVDDYGLPRVRCTCGNPLMPPVEIKQGAFHEGDPWPGFRAEEVVVVTPTAEAVSNLVIVNISNNTWIERRSGDDGAQDSVPAVTPPYDPSGPVPAQPPGEGATRPSAPCVGAGNSLARTAPPEPGRPAGTTATGEPCPTTAPPTAPPAPPETPADPGTGGRTEVPPADPGGDPTGGQGLPQDPGAGPADPYAPYDPGTADPYAPDLPDGGTGDPADPDGPGAPHDPYDPFTLPEGGLGTDPGPQLESA